MKSIASKYIIGLVLVSVTLACNGCPNDEVCSNGITCPQGCDSFGCPLNNGTGGYVGCATPTRLPGWSPTGALPVGTTSRQLLFVFSVPVTVPITAISATKDDAPISLGFSNLSSTNNRDWTAELTGLQPGNYQVNFDTTIRATC